MLGFCVYVVICALPMLVLLSVLVCYKGVLWVIFGWDAWVGGLCKVCLLLVSFRLVDVIKGFVYLCGLFRVGACFCLRWVVGLWFVYEIVGRSIRLVVVWGVWSFVLFYVNWFTCVFGLVLGDASFGRSFVIMFCSHGDALTVITLNDVVFSLCMLVLYWFSLEVGFVGVILGLCLCEYWICVVG